MSTDDDEEERVDTSESCDLGYACSYPPCVAAREAEEAHYRALFQAQPAPLSREEWDMAYADNLAKRLSFEENR